MSAQPEARVSKAKRNQQKQNVRRIDQILMTMALWFFPLALFGFVGFRLATATGLDPNDYELAIGPAEIAVAVGVILVCAAAVVWKRTHDRSAATAEGATATPHRAGRWDGYSTPYVQK